MAPSNTIPSNSPLLATLPQLFDPAAQCASPHFHQLVCLFSPKIAREVIAGHTGPNRNLSKRSVSRYRADMEAGVWSFTADPLRFDTAGLLIDGQHRLQALAELDDSRFVLPFSVALGLSSETIMAIDQGAKRTAGQQLGLRHVKNGTAMAAAVRIAIVWEEHGIRNGRGLSDAGPSVPLIERWIDEHEDLVDHVNTHMTALRNNDAPTGTATGAALILAQIDPVAEIEFFLALSEGGLPKDNPITVLDRRLARLRRERANYRQEEYLGMIFRVWNAWRKGDKMNKLIRPSDLANFPVPV